MDAALTITYVQWHWSTGSGKLPLDTVGQVLHFTNARGPEVLTYEIESTNQSINQKKVDELR